jgi:hypothetical protein
VLTRLLVWLGGAFVTMSVIAGWQLLLWPPATDSASLTVESRRLAVLALGGTAVALVAGWINVAQSGGLWSVLWTRLAAPYVVMALLGAAIGASAWLWQLRTGQLSRIPLAIAAAGTILALLGVSVLREIHRLQTVDLSAALPRHADAAQIGGLSVFLLFAVVNAGLIGLCIWLVQRGLRRTGNLPDRTRSDEDQAGASLRVRTAPAKNSR